MPFPLIRKADTCNSWDNIYTREISNHAADEQDEGTIWFDESGAEDAVVKLLEELEDEGELRKEKSSFLDLGTGNGHMLFTLRGEEEWVGEMVGVDYSLPSVELARRIAVQKELEEGIRFEEWDLLASGHGAAPEWMPEGGFDVVLDKGTFDAISLMPSDSATGRHPCETYRSVVPPLVKNGGWVVVTSCNWTKEELIGWLSGEEEGGLEYVREARYPTFQFGGKTGQSIVSVAFKRR